MARFFKKRRADAGPSKNELKARRGRDTGGPSLAARYPSVQKLEVRLEFLGAQAQVLEQESRAFGPGDECRFTAACPGRCGAGRFDLAAKIDAVVAARQTASESRGLCQEPLYAGSPENCGCELRCSIQAEYIPEPVSSPDGGGAGQA